MAGAVGATLELVSAYAPVSEQRLRAERPGTDFTISMRVNWDGRDLGEGDQALASADQLLYRLQIVAEGAARQFLDRVVELPAIEHVRHQHRAVIGRDLDAVTQQ